MPNLKRVFNPRRCSLASPREAEFRRLYEEELLPCRVIAERWGVSTEYVSGMKQRLGVATIAKWSRRNLPSLDEVPLRSVLLGSMLGDGSIHSVRDSVGGYSFAEAHSVKQRGYVEWKRSVWGGASTGGWAYAMGERAAQVIPHPDPTDSRMYQGRVQYGFNTVGHGALRSWWEVFYGEADIGKVGQRLKKFKASEVVSLVGGPSGLDDLALAVWYGDDGHAGHWPTLCVGKRNLFEAGVLLRVWGFDPTENSNGWAIRGREQAEEFIRRVSPVLLELPDMAYKVFDVGCRWVREEVTVPAAPMQEVGVPDVRGQVVALGMRGVSATEIASCVRRSRDWVVRVLVTAGQKPIRIRRPLLDEVVQRASAGESVQSLEQEFGWTPGSLGPRLKQAGVQTRARGGKACRVLLGAETPDRLREVLQEEGGSVLAVASRLGCPVSLLRTRVRSWGLEGSVVKQVGGRKVIDVSRGEVESLLASGLSRSGVASALGVTEGLLGSRLLQWGMTRPPKAVAGDEVVRLLGSGLTLAEAAIRLGSTRTSLSTALTRAGRWTPRAGEVQVVTRVYNRWKVLGPVGGVNQYLGTFATEAEAREAYHLAVLGAPARLRDVEVVAREMSVLGEPIVMSDVVRVGLVAVDVRTRLGVLVWGGEERVVSPCDVGPVYTKGWACRLGRAMVRLAQERGVC